MSLKLHHLNASRSQRLVWLLEEIGVEHEIVSYTRHAETRLAPDDLLHVHPMGKAPLLEHDGVVIAETGAIAQYLLAQFDTEHKLHPPADDPDFPIYLEWVHATEGAPFLPFLMNVYIRVAGAEGSPLDQRMQEEQVKSAALIEKHLAASDYFGGRQFTAADCLMGFNILALSQSPHFEQMPATAAWLEKVSARPAYKRMMDVGI